MPAGKTNQGTGALLQKNINSVRSRLLFVDVATGVSRLLVVLALLMSAGMMLDWGVDLSRDGRGLLLIVYASVASIMVWGGVLRPFFNQPNDDEIALIVERGIPDFRSRLIASLQLSRTVRTGGESSELVGALVDETEKFAKPRIMTPEELTESKAKAESVKAAKAAKTAAAVELALEKNA